MATNSSIAHDHVVTYRGKRLAEMSREELLAVIDEMAGDQREAQRQQHEMDMREIDRWGNEARARLNDPRRRSIIGLLIDALKGGAS